MNNIAQLIDHTNLKPDASESDIKKLCEETVEHGFLSACVSPVHVPLAASFLKEKKPKVCTVIGFPLGADSAEMKFAEARFLIHQGAEELDMVLNIGALKEGNIDILQREIGQVVNAADGNCVKVIIETCLLSTDEKVLACTLAQNSGADFVKTSTGFSSAGAIVEDVEIMRETVGDEAQTIIAAEPRVPAIGPVAIHVLKERFDALIVLQARFDFAAETKAVIK